MKTQDERRSFLKYLLSLSTFIAGSTLSLDKNNGLSTGNIRRAEAQGARSPHKRIKKIAVEEHWGSAQSLEQIEQRLKDMDSNGIDMQVLSSVFHNERLSPSDAAALARRMNDELSKVVEKYPKRFFAFAAISHQDAEAAAKEMERAVKQLGFRGAIISEHLLADEHLYNKKYGMIWEAAEKLDIPIYFHFAGTLKGAIGMGTDISMQSLEMILSGLFDKYPGLKIILGHMGEAMPFWLWRIDNRWKKDKGVSPEMPESKLSKAPGEYFKKHFYVATSGQFSIPVLQLAHSVMGAERILFAVDYPPESNIDAVQFIESAPIDDDDKEKICHLNAEKLFKIKTS
jgi:5-carboxyvanillate decarboxylase